MLLRLESTKTGQRKAMQELREVELEEKQMALAQKRLHLEKELAEMEGN